MAMKHYYADIEKYRRFGREHYYRYHERNKKSMRDNAKRSYLENPDIILDRNQSWRMNNSHKNYLSKLKAAFGITELQYTNLIMSQLGCCAICKRYTQKGLEVDHDHKTGKIRGMLCHNCNSTLGHAKDDISRLEAAINYLKEHNDANPGG